MFRITAAIALVSLLISWGAGGAVAASAERSGATSGLPPVTYEEIVGEPPASAGFSLSAIAMGAVAGVMVANMILPVFGYAAVPAALAGSPVTGATVEAALASSRFVAVAAAAAGGVVGQWVYAGWSR